MLRGVILALVIVSGLSVGLLAQQPTVDPILGTWTLNVQRSRFPRTDVSAPKGHVEVYRRVADRIERTSTRPAPDGSSSITRVTWPTEGGFAVYEQGQVPQGRTIIEALISSGEWYAIFLQDGKQYQTIRKMIANDGKTMTQVIRGVDTQGKPFEQLNVYDRQE
jgi:hypothetical protein